MNEDTTVSLIESHDFEECCEICDNYAWTPLIGKDSGNLLNMYEVRYSEEASDYETVCENCLDEVLANPPPF